MVTLSDRLIRIEGEQIDGSEFTGLGTLRIRGNSIEGSGFSGLGTQCAVLIQHVETILPGCVWFAANLDVTYGPGVELGEKTPRFIGQTSAMVRFVEAVPQFIWGVFLAVPIANMPPTWTREYWAEDDPPETLDGAMFELRPFDTSYFECYAADDAMLDALALALGVNVIPWNR